MKLEAAIGNVAQVQQIIDFPVSRGNVPNADTTFKLSKSIKHNKAVGENLDTGSTPSENQIHESFDLASKGCQPTEGAPGSST